MLSLILTAVAIYIFSLAILIIALKGTSVRIRLLYLDFKLLVVSLITYKGF
jgi:hypothetical protein